MASIHEGEVQAAWRRFTLLDLFLFQVAFGISFSMIFAAPIAWEKVPFSLSMASVLALLLAGPIVLGTQYLARGRRDRLSGGEWLWLSPLLLLVILALLSLVEYVLLEVIGLMLGFVSTLASVFSVAVAVALLMAHADRGPAQLPCYWTDRFGIFVALYTHLTCWLWVFIQVSAAGR